MDTELIACREALDKANAEIKRLSAENEWFRNAQGIRDAEDEAALLAYKAEVERLRARVGELEGVLRVFYEKEMSWRRVSLDDIKRASHLLDGAK